MITLSKLDIDLDNGLEQVGEPRIDQGKKIVQVDIHTLPFKMVRKVNDNTRRKCLTFYNEACGVKIDPNYVPMDRQFIFCTLDDASMRENPQDLITSITGNLNIWMKLGSTKEPDKSKWVKLENFSKYRRSTTIADALGSAHLLGYEVFSNIEFSKIGSSNVYDIASVTEYNEFVERFETQMCSFGKSLRMHNTTARKHTYPPEDMCKKNYLMIVPELNEQSGETQDMEFLNELENIFHSDNSPYIYNTCELFICLGNKDLVIGSDEDLSKFDEVHRTGVMGINLLAIRDEDVESVGVEQIPTTSAIKCKMRFADSVMSDVTFDELGNYMAFLNSASLIPENGGPGLSTSIASAYVSNDRKELTVIYSISDKLPASGTANYNFSINGLGDRFPITIDIDSINNTKLDWKLGPVELYNSMLQRNDKHSRLESFTQNSILTGDSKYVFLMFSRSAGDGVVLDVESLRTSAYLTIQNRKYYPAALTKEEALALGWANIDVNAPDAKFTNPTSSGDSYDMYWMIFKIPLANFINSYITSWLAAMLTVDGKTEIFDISIPSNLCYPGAIVPKIISAKVSSMDGSGAYVDVLGSKDKNVYLPELIYNTKIGFKVIIDFAKQDFTEIGSYELEIMKEMIVMQFDNNKLFNKFVEYPDSSKYGDYVTTYSDYIKTEDGQRKYFKRVEFKISLKNSSIDEDRLRHFKLSAFTFDTWNYQYTNNIFSNLNIYVPKSDSMLQCNGNFNDEKWWELTDDLSEVWLSGFQHSSGAETFIPQLISFKVKSPAGVNKAEYVKTLMFKAHVFFKLYNDYNDRVSYLKAWNILDVRGEDNSREALTTRAKTMHIPTSAGYVLATNAIKGVTTTSDRYFTYDEMMTKMHSENDFYRLNHPFLENGVTGQPVVKNYIDYYYDLPREESDETTFIIGLGEVFSLYRSGLNAPQSYEELANDPNQLNNIIHDNFVNREEKDLEYMNVRSSSQPLKFANRLKAFVVFDDTAKDAVITSDVDFSKFKNVVELPERKVTMYDTLAFLFDNAISRVDVLNPYTMEELQFLANKSGGSSDVKVPITLRVYTDYLKAHNQRFDLVGELERGISILDNETLEPLIYDTTVGPIYTNDSFIETHCVDLDTLMTMFPHHLSFPIAASYVDIFSTEEQKQEILKVLHHIKPIKSDNENVFMNFSLVADKTTSSYMLIIPLALSSLETTASEVAANISELKINNKVIDKSKIVYVNTPELQSKYTIPSNIDYFIGLEGTLEEFGVVQGKSPLISATYNGITKTW